MLIGCVGEPDNGKTSRGKRGEDAQVTQVTACWLTPPSNFSSSQTYFSSNTNGSEQQVPVDCSVENEPFQTHIQESYCKETPRHLHRKLEITDRLRSGGPFIHVGCGSGWCRHFQVWSDYMWKLASADASLQFLQARFGCECIHCGVALSLVRKRLAARLPQQSLLRQPQCD